MKTHTVTTSVKAQKLCSNCGLLFSDDAIRPCCGAPIEKRGLTMLEAYLTLAKRERVMLGV